MQFGTKMQFILFFSTFILLNVLVWISTNAQLVEGANQRSTLIAAVVLAIPISLLAYYGTRIGYEYFGTAWSVRLSVFGISYLVFPFLTYFYLNESPFQAKTVLCILLSIAILCVQVFWPHN